MSQPWCGFPDDFRPALEGVAFAGSEQPGKRLIKYRAMYENARNSLDQKRMIDMGVYFSSLIDARSTWPGNGKSPFRAFLCVLPHRISQSGGG